MPMLLQGLQCRAQPRTFSSPWHFTLHQAYRRADVPSSTGVRGVRKPASVNSNNSSSAAGEKQGTADPVWAAQQDVDAPKQQFNWYKPWYPVAILEDLDSRLPMHAQLLGMDLAIFWDSNANQWRCAGMNSRPSLVHSLNRKWAGSSMCVCTVDISYMSMSPGTKSSPVNSF